MGFFKDFKDDFSQAVNELLPGDDFAGEDEIQVNTLDSELDVEQELSKLDGLLEQVEKKSSQTLSEAVKREPELPPLDEAEGEASVAYESLPEPEVPEEPAAAGAEAEPVVTGMELQKERKAKVKPEAEPKAEVKPEVELKAEVKPEAEPDVRPEPEAVQQAEMRSEPEPEPKSKVKVTKDAEDYEQMEAELQHAQMKEIMKEEKIMDTMDTMDATVTADEAAVEAEIDAEVANSEVTDEVSVITAGTSIKGNMETTGSFEVEGKIEGDIKCNGKLTVIGSVLGNSASSEFFADAAHIEGEVVSSGTVKVGLGSVIIGNITATSAVIAGAVKGDIDVQGPVVVDTSAVIMGNIKSRSVQINNGAVIEGFCSQCYSDVDVESLFAKRK